jgi:hypothetical protein
MMGFMLNMAGRVTERKYENVRMGFWFSMEFTWHSPFFFVFSFDSCSHINFFLFERKKLQKRSKKPAVLSLIDFKRYTARSPVLAVA